MEIPRLELPADLDMVATKKEENQDQLREIDRQKRVVDPTFKGAFHEKKFSLGRAQKKKNGIYLKIRRKKNSIERGDRSIRLFDDILNKESGNYKFPLSLFKHLPPSAGSWIIALSDVYFNTSRAANTKNIKLVAPPPNTYSVCCQK